MVTKIIWAEPAKRRMREIFDYYEETAGKRTARKMRGKIETRVDILATNPLAGQREEQLTDRPEGFRYLVEGNYKVLYFVADGAVNITTIWDCRQNPVRMTEEVAAEK